MRALIAEDEFISRNVLKEFLSPLFEVDEVANGVEAIEAFAYAHNKETPYDLILMDIMMPEFNGLDALERIRALERERGLDPVKVIMTTALSDTRTVIRSFDTGGASAYIVKPITRDKLYEELKRLELIIE